MQTNRALLIEHADLLVTMDAHRRELRDGALVIDGPAIVWVGATADVPAALRAAAHQTIDARGRIVLPGFVNTHHHFYQTLTRALSPPRKMPYSSTGSRHSTPSGRS
jgi:cytosine/adenosine deaminase-related metal-dependent hydrolase